MLSSSQQAVKNAKRLWCYVERYVESYAWLVLEKKLKMATKIYEHLMSIKYRGKLHGYATE